MSETAYNRYSAICAALDTDEEYLALKAHFGENEPCFLTVMESLSPRHRDIIMQHIGICGELHERIVEIACFLP